MGRRSQRVRAAASCADELARVRLTAAIRRIFFKRSPNGECKLPSLQRKPTAWAAKGFPRGWLSPVSFRHAVSFGLERGAKTDGDLAETVAPGLACRLHSAGSLHSAACDRLCFSTLSRAVRSRKADWSFARSNACSGPCAPKS